MGTNEYAANNGSLLQNVLADGTVLSYTYNEYGRITSSTVNSDTVNSYLYDNDGNVKRRTDAIGNQVTEFDYNDSGLVVRTEVYAGDTTSSDNLESRMQYTYTKGGLVGGLSYEEADGNVRTYTYTYAADELPTKSEHPDGSNTQWSYDVLRRNTQTVFTPKSGAAAAKKLYTTYAYQNIYQDIDGATKTVTTPLVSTYTNKFGSTGTAVSQFNYLYDTWGNITKITDVGNRERSYTYNDQGEVATASEAYGNGTTATYAYTYDAGGNILTETVNDTVHTYVYDSVWKDKLISYDGKAITYDQFGCPITYMGATMTWDANGNLISITGETPNGTASNISYSYLSGGQRSEKTVDGVTTKYHYNNGMLLSETTGDETLRYFYDSAGRVASFTYKKGTNAEVGYFFARNYQSDIIAIYRSSDSKLIGTYEYDLWGRPVSITEATAGIDTDGILTKNPFRYRGYYYDSETGFYNLNLRYYDPTICRFISADSMDLLTAATMSVNSKNLFNYCENNPVIARDSTGAFWDTLFDVASLVVSVVDVFKDPTSIEAWAGLIGDAVDLCPFVTGVGEAVKGGRILGKADDLKDATKAADNALDASKATTKLDNVVEGGSKTDFYATTNGTIIPANKVKANSQYDRLEVEVYSGNAMRPKNATDDWDSFLGPNQTDIDPRTGQKSLDRIWSADGTRSIRFGDHEMGGMGTKNFHYHRETWYDDYVYNEVQRIQPR